MIENKIYRSPLFYVGDKFKLIKQIKQYFPDNIKNFIEPFTGGGSVFLNTNAKKFLLNDIDKNIINLHKFLTSQSINKSCFFKKLEEQIFKYDLSYSYKTDYISQELKEKYKKTYYAHYNKEAFKKLKVDFNNNKTDILKLYILLIYGFNRMIRFNLKGDYNLPVGNVDFNANVFNALNDYLSLITTKNIKFYNLDYKDFINSIKITQDDFIYIDPPYLITCSEYNKYWDIQKEKNLLDLINHLNKKNIKFALSNVIHYKCKTNNILKHWADDNKYNIFPIKSNYISYHDNSKKDFLEVLITNYEKS